MGIFGRFLGKDTASEKPSEKAEDVMSPEMVAKAIAEALAVKFTDQKNRGELASHVGRLAIAIGPKAFNVLLETYIDQDGMAPILSRAGEILDEHGMRAEVAEVVDERNSLKNVVSTHVEVTPEPLIPPDDRAVFYPPNSGNPAPLIRLSPRPGNSPAISLDFADIANPTSPLNP